MGSSMRWPSCVNLPKAILGTESSRPQFRACEKLVNDTQGKAVKCRYIVVPRRETVGFSFAKESASTWQGRSVFIIKMEPVSPIIGELVDPLLFTIEAEGQHRVLEYTGRTTPKIRAGNKWKDLEAVTVFDWK